MNTTTSTEAAAIADTGADDFERIGSATYSPDDNKLRIYPLHRLPADVYARVKAAGFAWAPKQELFVAPMWTPERAALAIELCGEIGDEDTSLCDRAEERADRFEGYSDKRASEAGRARDAVAAIADGIPLGQPILIGHHSQRRAERDAQKIRRGMEKAVQLWETSEYWTRRAAGALRAAKYKERADVRARRIKGLESDQRKHQKEHDTAAKFVPLWESVIECGKGWKAQRADGTPTTPQSRCTVLAGYMSAAGCCSYDFWSGVEAGRITPEEAQRSGLESCRRTMAHHARWLSHYANRLTYERAMLAEAGGLVADQYDLQPGGVIVYRGGRRGAILRVNKRDGRAVSVTVTGRSYGPVGIEEITGYEAPTEETAGAVAAVLKKPPLCNYPGAGFVHITQAQWDACGSDYKSTTREVKAAEAEGLQPHRARVMLGVYAGLRSSDANVSHSYPHVYITDAKRTDPPKIGEEVKAPRKRMARKIAEAAGVDMADTPDEAKPIEASADGAQLFPLGGRVFRVLATFLDTDDGTAAANAYIEANDGAAVLAVDGGRIILAHRDDKGTDSATAHRQAARSVLADATTPTMADTQADILRMQRAREEREARQAESADFAAMREALRTGAAVQAVSAPQLFPTPADVAARMVELADIKPGSRIAEPSAGTGALLQALRESGAFLSSVVHAWEIVPALARRLESNYPGAIVRAFDFLQFDPNPAELFDVVLMNPPFADGADIKHINHARRFLAPGGRLVAICAAGPRQHAALQPLADSWEYLEPGTFAGTNVRAVLLTMRAPGLPPSPYPGNQNQAQHPAAPAAADFGPPAPAQIAAIVCNAIWRRLNWTDAPFPIAAEIEREARGLDECCAQPDFTGPTAAAYRAAAERLRAIAAAGPDSDAARAVLLAIRNN